jgi:hypothetical protein
MLWPPCDAAILGMKQSPKKRKKKHIVTALQPCIELPLQVKNSTQVKSECACL